MSGLAIVFMIVGIFMIAGINLCQTYLISRRILTKKEVLIVQHGLSFILLLTAMIWWQGGGTEVEYNYKIFWIAVIGTSLFNIILQYAHVWSLQLSKQTSLVTPIQAMTPGMVTLMALVFKEYPSLIGICGILLITTGTYVHLSENAKTWKDYLKPFMIRRILQYPKNEKKALMLAYLAAICGSFGLVFDGLVARNGDIGLGFAMEALILTATYSMLTTNKQEDVIDGKPWQRYRKYWIVIILLGLFYGLHVVFVMTSFRMEMISYIGSLKRLHILIVVLLAGPLLGEVKAKRRIWPSLIMSAGAILIALDDHIPNMVEKVNALIH